MRFICYNYTYFAARTDIRRVNLVIDIGNSVAKLALFDGQRLVNVYYGSNRSLEALAYLSGHYAIERAILSSVVEINGTMRHQLDALPCEPVRVSSALPLPVRILYRSPQTLGSDRIAAVVGAQGEMPGRDILVIDAGTCLTYEFVDADGNYHGGNIAPGKLMRLKAMNALTAKLPLVSPDGETPPLGYDTETAMRAGVVKGMEYEIQGYIMDLRRKYPGLLVFLTGGDDFSFDTSLKNIIFADKFLVLKGLNRILEYNDNI